MENDGIAKITEDGNPQEKRRPATPPKHGSWISSSLESSESRS